MPAKQKQPHRVSSVITDKERPMHALPGTEVCQRTTAEKSNIVELLAMPEADSIEFEALRMNGELYRPAEL